MKAKLGDLRGWLHIVVIHCGITNTKDMFDGLISVQKERNSFAVDRVDLVHFLSANFSYIHR